MKKVIGDLIGDAQSEFIEGRTIIDNILFAYELFKGYNGKGIYPRCVLKVDIRKSYDSLDQAFLKRSVMEMGLPSKFGGWIMSCITTVSCSLTMISGLTKLSRVKGA